MTKKEGRNGQLMKVLLASVALGALVPGAARSQGELEVFHERQFQFDLPPQTLTKALTAYAKVTGVQLAYSSDLTGNLKSEGLRGSFTRSEALDKLLEGKSLKYKFTDALSVTIQSDAANARAQGNLPEINVIGEGPANVLGGDPKAAPGGFIRSEARVGILGNRSIMEVPFSVTSFTAQFINDKQALMSREVLQNDPAVQWTGTAGFYNETFTIRGFPANVNSSIYDGQPVGSLPKFGVELVDSITVLKGPGAVLYGIPAFPGVGGVVNYMPKRPLPYDYNSVTARWVEPEYGGVNFDVSRRYGEKREFGIRVNGAYFDGEVWPETRVQHPAGMISMDWKPTDNLRMYLDLVYTQMRNTRDQLQFALAAGVPVPGAPSAKVNYLQPWNYTNNPYALAFFKTEYDINANWKVDATYRHSYLGNNFLAVTPTITNVNGTYTQTLFLRDKQHYEVDGGQANLRGNFYTLGVKHEPTFGFDIEDATIFQTPNFFPSFPGFGTTLTSSFAFPIYTAKPIVPSLVERKSLNTRTETFYANDMITLPGDYVQLFVGARSITFKQDAFNTTTGAQTSTYNDSKLLPIYAVLFHPTKTLTFYGSYSQGFEKGGIAGPTAINVGAALPPIPSEQYEAGAKLQAFGLTATIAGFQISRASEYVDPITRIFGQFGLQTHTGVEATVSGEPVKGTRFIVGGMTLDAVVTNTGNITTEGKVPIGVSRNSANLYVEQDLPWHPAFTLNGGVYYASQQYFDATNQREIPGWTRFDLGARYRTLLANKYVFTARFNVENVADKQYWVTTLGGLGLAQPRTYKVSGQFQW